jgi:HD-GYP domain-containing protein (c-di-GMP phosphodiesterase class II)
VQNQRIQLRSLAGEHEGRVWEGDALLHVGRLPTFEVTVKDASVSRQHAELEFTAQGWVVRDLGSTNGTFLNGARVARAEQKVRKGDILQFGDITMIVDFKGWVARTEPGADNADAQIAGAVKYTWEQLSHALGSGGALGSAATNPLLLLLQAGRDFYRFSTTEDYLQSVLWQVAEGLNAQRGAVLLRDEVTGQLVARAVFALSGESGSSAWSDNSLASRALEYETTLLCQPAGYRAGEGRASQLPSVIYAVLRSPRGRLGILCLVREVGQPPFTEPELKLADALALCVSPGIDSMAHLFGRERDVSLQTLTALTQAVEMRGDAIYGQTQRVTDYALLLAEELNLSEQDRHSLRIGVPLRDLGKIGVNDGLFQKAVPLTPEEQESIRSHVLKGTNLLESIPALAFLLPLVRSHHEWWDGSGYPDALRGEQIPRLARVVAVAEALDAVTTDRPYRQALALPEAFAEIQRQAGIQFDPACVDALVRLRPRIEQLVLARKQSTDTLSRDALQEIVGSLGTRKRTRDKRSGQMVLPGVPG